MPTIMTSLALLAYGNRAAASAFNSTFYATATTLIRVRTRCQQSPAIRCSSPVVGKGLSDQTPRLAEKWHGQRGSHRLPIYLDLGKISVMAGPVRVTGPLLDVLEVFLRASGADDGELHGWAIMKATKRTGPTVYGVLDRLEDMGWITGRWEDQNPEASKPRRRLYHLTPTGVIDARQILAERRPQGHQRPVHQVPGPARPSWLHRQRVGGAT